MPPRVALHAVHGDCFNLQLQVPCVDVVEMRCTLRFVDHRGLVPSRIRLLRSGLRGTLVWTKTSGVGKSREELEVVIDHSAFLFMPAWLQTGWALWERMGTGRDYFMGLPTPDLMGIGRSKQSTHMPLRWTALCYSS